MKINELDLSGLMYNPTSKKDIKKLQEDHKPNFDFHWYENDKLVKYHDSILKYIILVYDLNSPLYRSEKDHNEKKVKAMLMAEMEFKDGKFDQPIRESLLYGSDQGIARMIAKYVYLFNNIDYAELVGMIEINFQILRDIMNAKKVKDTHKQLEQTSDRIRELTKRVFGGEETKDIKEKLYEQLNMSRLSFRPEEMAKQHSEGAGNEMFAKDIYKKRRKKKDE